MIQFCPKCKSILRPRKENEKIILYCSCGYTAKSGQDNSSLKDGQKKEKEVELDVADENHEVLPITKEDCPKCGNKEAYYWLVQTRAADEAATKFLKCTKCKKTWRDYS